MNTQVVSEVAVVAPVATTPAAAATSATEGGKLSALEILRQRMSAAAEVVAKQQAAAAVQAEAERQQVAAEQRKIEAEAKALARAEKLREQLQREEAERAAKQAEREQKCAELLAQRDSLKKDITERKVALQEARRLLSEVEKSEEVGLKNQLTTAIADLEGEIVSLQKEVEGVEHQLLGYGFNIQKYDREQRAKLPKVPEVIRGNISKRVEWLRLNWAEMSSKTFVCHLTGERMPLAEAWTLPVSPGQAFLDEILAQVVSTAQAKVLATKNGSEPGYEGSGIFPLALTLQTFAISGGRENRMGSRPVVVAKTPVKPAAPVAPVKKVELKMPALPPAEEFKTRFDDKEGLTLFMRGRGNNFQTFALSREGEVLEGKLELGELGFEKLANVFDRPTREKHGLELVDLNAVKRKLDRQRKVQSAQDKKAADERGTVYGAAKTAPAPKQKGEEEGKKNGKPGKKK